MTSESITHNGYKPGHPWYYLRGGKVLPPRRIMELAQASGYRGYNAGELDRIDALAEPKRSEALRAMKARIVAQYRRDLSRYRELALALHRKRRKEPDGGSSMRCEEIHQSIRFKYSHLYNDFAHLCELDRLLAKQRDLFDL